MYERSYGTAYDGSLSTKEIAALVRKELRAADYLEGYKVSVRYESFAGGTAIRVKLTADYDLHVRHDFEYDFTTSEQGQCQFVLDNGERCQGFGNRGGQLFWIADDARDVYNQVQAVLNKYNHDGSDTQSDYFDYNFYSSITLEGGR